MDSQIQIGQGVHKIEGLLQGCVSAWALLWYLGAAGNRSLSHSAQQKQNISQQVRHVQVVWLRKLIFGLFDQVPDSTIIYCDNQSCIRLSEHPVFHERSKHIEIKYYFIWDKVHEREVNIQYISIDEKTIDILTNPLSRIKFAYLWYKLGIMEITPLAEREEMAL